MKFNDVIQSGNYVVLDTETSGLGYTAEICQIAIIDSSGNTLLDTLVKPVGEIPADATAIHGITNEMVAAAPGWDEVSAKVFNAIEGKHVIIYNAQYDRKLMHQSAEHAGLEKIDWKLHATFHCAMLAFAPIYGDYNSYYQSYRWKSLELAARCYELPVIDAHTALGDCQMTLAVCKAMAAGQPIKK